VAVGRLSVGVSSTRLGLALLFFGCAAGVLIIAADPATWAPRLDFLESALLPILFDAFILLGFVTAATGLFAKRELGLVAFSGLVVYAVAGVAIRWASASAIGQPFTWAPDQVLVSAVRWPSYLAPFLLPQLWP
jgi:hypothetical protein